MFALSVYVWEMFGALDPQRPAAYLGDVEFFRDGGHNDDVGGGC
jgi:hypothetical protein